MPVCTPHPANVPGDFYVEDRCCTMCLVPLVAAPELFGQCEDPRGGYQHCFVKRQPETADELTQMLEAVQCAELRCIHYQGTDRLIQLQLIGLNSGDVCDVLSLDLKRRVDRKAAWQHNYAKLQTLFGFFFGETSISNGVMRRLAYLTIGTACVFVLNSLSAAWIAFSLLVIWWLPLVVRWVVMTWTLFVLGVIEENPGFQGQKQFSRRFVIHFLELGVIVGIVTLLGGWILSRS